MVPNAQVQGGDALPTSGGMAQRRKSGEELLALSNHPEKGESSMSTEENKALARRQFEEIWNQGKLDLIDTYFSSDFINFGNHSVGLCSCRIMAEAATVGA